MISLKAKLFSPPRSLTVAHYSVCSERSSGAWESPHTQGAGGRLQRSVSFLGLSSPQEIPWRAQDTTEMEKEGWGREWPKRMAQKQGVRESAPLQVLLWPVVEIKVKPLNSSTEGQKEGRKSQWTHKIQQKCPF